MNSSLCLVGQVCENFVGSFKCVYPPCDDGYHINVVVSQCEDDDECFNTTICGNAKICVNIPGSYRCNNEPCLYGYERNSVEECVGMLSKKLLNLGNLVLLYLLYCPPRLVRGLDLDFFLIDLY